MTVTRSLRAFWREDRPIARIGYVVGGLSMASGLTHLIILIASGGPWEGPLSWRKPTTFGLSFGVTLITVVWVSSFVRLSTRARTILLASFTGACVLEVALVSLQTWRGVPSHFNIETSLDASIARTLAFGGAVLVVVIITLMVAAFRGNPGVAPSMRLAIRVSFVALVIAQLVGATMIAKGMLLVFGGNPQAAYATGGTLKPLHAAAMHGIQVLPVSAWLLSFVDWPERRRVFVIALIVAAYVVVVAGVAIANLAG